MAKRKRKRKRKKKKRKKKKRKKKERKDGGGRPPPPLFFHEDSEEPTYEAERAQSFSISAKVVAWIMARHFLPDTYRTVCHGFLITRSLTSRCGWPPGE